jgi:hypothetical protein
MKSRRVKNRLPRITMLAMSAQELCRFSNAVEQGVAMMGTLCQLVRTLADLVERFEKRSEAAAKPNRTRNAAAVQEKAGKHEKVG